jgi:hypothetical protein
MRKLFRDVSFVYRGFRVIPSESGHCAKCKQKEWIENFEKHAKRIVEIKRKRINVNWRMFRKKATNGYSHDIVEVVIESLRDLGVLSREIQGGWKILAPMSGFNYNPRDALGTLYFVRRKDVLEYALLLSKEDVASGCKVPIQDIYHIDKAFSLKQGKVFDRKI